MRTLLTILLVGLRAAVAEGSVGAVPPPETDACADCHGEAVWEGEKARLFVSKESRAKDAHFLKGVGCHDCHGGDPTTFDVLAAHATEVDKNDPKARPFRLPLSELRKDFELCGRCHQSSLGTYAQSAHGRGVQRSGLVVSPACVDCHGAHGVRPASDPQSPLHFDRVGATCGKCHALLERVLQQSVHGRAAGPGAAAKTAAAGEGKRRPACTDCHEGHDPPRQASMPSRLASPDRCGSCHAALSSGYAISMHGSLTELGYGPAAKCSDCHGAHDVLKVSHPDSKLSPANRRETCGKCHPDAVANFLDFDPHADHRVAERDPLLHWVYWGLLTLLFSTFGVFGVHSLLWFVRGLVHVLQHGRARPLVPGTIAYTRFGPFHRVAHTVMVLSFLGLALTGLPLKYSQQGWAHVVAAAFGGFESTGSAHRVFAVVNLGCLVVYMFRMLGRLVAGPPGGGSRMAVVFGPDSPVPNLRDAKDFFRMVRWFFGLGPKPTFERWTYWEKFDFWGACADIVIIGATGLVLWFPNLFCAYLPGKTLNIAKVIHSTQALLATGFVFAIHFFSTHLRPEKFPMDMSMLTGRVSEEDLHEERPEYLERMRREGRLEDLKTHVPPRDVLGLSLFGGAVALFAGLSLLAGILLAALGG